MTRPSTRSSLSDPPNLRTTFDIDHGEHPVRVDLRGLEVRLHPVYNQGGGWNKQSKDIEGKV